MHEQGVDRVVPRPRTSSEGRDVPAGPQPGPGGLPRLGTLVGVVDDVVEAVVDRLVDSVEVCLAGLEAMPTATVLERLEYVALCAATAWDAPGLWIGSVDGDRLTTRRCRDLAAARASEGRGCRCAEGDDLQQHLGPLSTRDDLVRVLDGGSVLARPGDGSELGARLPALGLGAAVAAGGYDHDARQWLVAVLMEEAGADAAIARLALTSLVQAALAMPVVVRRR